MVLQETTGLVITREYQPGKDYGSSRSCSSDVNNEQQRINNWSGLYYCLSAKISKHSLSVIIYSMCLDKSADSGRATVA